MLKRLVILGLLIPLAMVGILASQDVSKGTPEQRVVKQEPGKKGQEQPQGQGNNQAATSPIPAAPQPATPTADKPSQNGSEERQIQRWLVYFTGALVVVGVFQFGSMIWQAWLLRTTRGDVKRQADWMETQAGHMNSQVGLMRDQTSHMVSQLDEMQRQADTMEEQNRTARERERARLSIYQCDNPEYFSEGTLLDSSEIPVKVCINVVNDGSTMAFNVSAVGHVHIGNFIDQSVLTPVIDDPEEWYDLAIPRTIRAIGVESQIPVLVTYMAGIPNIADFIAFRKADMIAVANRKASLRISGEICYEDIFGDEHKTPFHYLWIVTGNDNGQPWLDGSQWVDLSGKST
jgi:hypothetical protein